MVGFFWPREGGTGPWCGSVARTARCAAAHTSKGRLPGACRARSGHGPLSRTRAGGGGRGADAGAQAAGRTLLLPLTHQGMRFSSTFMPRSSVPSSCACCTAAGGVSDGVRDAGTIGPTHASICVKPRGARRSNVSLGTKRISALRGVWVGMSRAGSSRERGRAGQACTRARVRQGGPLQGRSTQQGSGSAAPQHTGAMRSPPARSQCGACSPAHHHSRLLTSHTPRTPSAGR